MRKMKKNIHNIQYMKFHVRNQNKKDNTGFGMFFLNIRVRMSTISVFMP